jgi:alkylation response protein AidB-like acyl-CoA dehydrogenase
MSGREVGPSSSIRKALADDHGEDVMNLARDMSGAFGTLLPGHASAPERSGGPATTVDGSLPEGPPWAAREWATGFIYSRALTIGGGTAEVQRNIVAERLLGLPRDAAAGDANHEERRPSK